MSWRKIDTRIWNDSKFRDLSDDGKLVFLFLLSHPHLTSLGAMRATVAGLAAELGWSVERFAEAFAEAFAKGMIENDAKACYVGLPNFLKYNPPGSPNVVKSWAGLIDLVPECEAKVQMMARVKGFTEGMGEAFAKALPKAFRDPFLKTMPNLENEIENEIEQEKEKKSSITSNTIQASADPFNPPSNDGLDLARSLGLDSTDPHTKEVWALRRALCEIIQPACGDNEGFSFIKNFSEDLVTAIKTGQFDGEATAIALDIAHDCENANSRIRAYQARTQRDMGYVPRSNRHNGEAAFVVEATE